MIILITIFIFFSNLISGSLGGNKFIYYLSILLLAFLFGGVYDIADEVTYKFYYNNVLNDTLLNKYSFFSAPGWYMLNYIAKIFNLSFQQFRFFICVLCLSFLSKSITKYSANWNITLLLFLIFPFIIDAVQIRNFLAYSIFVYSLRFLNENNRFNVVFLLMTLLTSSIHQTFILFIPFIFFYKLRFKQIYFVTIFSILVFIYLIKSNILLNLAKVHLNEVLFFKISPYLNKSGLGFFVLWFVQLVFIYISYKTKKIVYFKNFRNDKKFKDYTFFLNTVVKLNFYALILTIPLVILDGTFFRIFRNLFICNFIVITYLFFVFSKNKYFYLFITTSFTLLILNISINTPLNVKTVLKPFFNKNIYFNK